MKKLVLLFWLAKIGVVHAQQLQLHYDFRHSIDPGLNRKNFPSLSFEYFNSNDSTRSFLLKTQTDFSGAKHNASQTFLQVSQSLRFWKPKIFLSLNYSGGLGIAPPNFGFAISNAYGLGLAYPFQWKGAWLSAGVTYRYNAFHKGSHDGQLLFYFWKGFLNYRLQVSGSIVAWTQNRDIGIDFTKGLHGKKFAFFGDPQIWWKLWKSASIGTRLNLFHHVLTDGNQVQVYPTLGVKWEVK